MWEGQRTATYLQYLAEFGKSYNDVEEVEKRAQIFSITDQYIKDWNESRNDVQLAHNEFSDEPELGEVQSNNKFTS